MNFLTNLFNRNLIVWLIILNALLYLALAFSPLKPKAFGDDDFHIEAKTISQYIYGKEAWERVSITKAPGPVFFYTIPYLAAGPDAPDKKLLLFGIIWIGLLFTLVFAALYKRIGLTYGYPAANVFTLLTFVLPMHIYYSMGIIAEGMAYIAVLCMIVGYLHPQALRKGLWYVTGTVLLVLARPNAALVLPVLIVFSLFFGWVKKDRSQLVYIRYALIAGAIVFLSSLFVKSLPNTRNTEKQDEYFLYIAHFGRFQFRTETFDWRFWADETRPDSKDYIDAVESRSKLKAEEHLADSLGQEKKVILNWIINDILSHPFITLKQFVVRIMFGNTMQINSMANQKKGAKFWLLHIGINLINYVTIILAFYWLFTKGHLKKYWPIYSVIIALWVFHGLVYIEPRYFFPTRAAFVFFAGLGVMQLINRRKVNTKVPVMA